MDASKDFVASGSEDSNGYIWEKNYGILLAKLGHDECVNCVFFNPQDQQTCITASDDYTLQLWISKKHARLGSWLVVKILSENVRRQRQKKVLWCNWNLHFNFSINLEQEDGHIWSNLTKRV